MKARAIVRPLAGALAILVVLPALLFTALLLHPEWFLTSKSVGRGIRSFGRAYDPRWSRLDFEIRSPDVFEKEISFSAAGLCFARRDGSLSGCVKSLEAKFTVALAPTGARVTKLALDVEGETLRLDETKGPPKTGSKDASTPAKRRLDPFRLPRLLPAALRGLKLEKLAVDLPSVEIVQDGATTKGAVRASFDPARPVPLSLDARWRQFTGGAVQGGRIRVAVASDLFRNGQLSYADAKGAFDAEGAHGVFTVKARQSGADAVSVDAEASGRRDGIRVRLRGRGLQTPTRYAFTGSLGVEASTGPLRSLRLEAFNFTASRKRGDALPSDLHLDAALRAEPVSFRPMRGFTPPRFMGGKIVLNARASPKLFQKDHFDADLSIVLNPYRSWYEAHADLFAKASGRTSALPLMKIEQRVDADVAVARFEDLVAFLADSPYAVPAPLNALKGSLRASFSDRGDPQGDRVAFDYRMRADLSGEKQKLRFHVAGSGQATRVTSADRALSSRGTATLDDVAIQMPHLDALKLPKVALDPRIKSARTKEEERAAAETLRRTEVVNSTPAVTLDLGVVTARPLLLYSDLTKSPVPIALNLKLAPPPGLPTGIVEVRSFDVEFFRRNATVDHLTLTFRPGSKVVGLDGLVKYKAAEALISIRLLGTTDKPQVVFESDPPMNQSDIVAMLLFGKSPDDLDADQAATVANSQTAMSDEAFGLASLYLFASTPVQFVGYDPATKSYTMKLRVPGGETLSLNSDFDTTRSVQLRRRLSKHFAIVEEAVSSQTEGNGFVTLLEWFTRY